MKKVIYIFITLFISLMVAGQTQTDEKQRDLSFYTSINKWFSAWKLVSEDIYKIDTVKPVDFIFFDDKYVYSTSLITIKNGTSVKGPNFTNLKLKWKKQLHNGSITFPDKSVVPVNLMSFASENPEKPGTSFFVMPLPSFWKKSGVTSKELGLENLVTGVFIHEFSHSQQMQSFGKNMSQFEKTTNFGIEFSDDIVQNLFDKDTTYINHYKKEVTLFYETIKDNKIDKKAVQDGLAIMNQRQKEYFKGQYENLTQIDNFFLTMEGLGQYSMYLWLTHPKGGNIQKDIAIQGVRRGGKWWSQDEGFALFLILEKLNKPENWAKNMFGETATQSVVQLIDEIAK